MHDVGSLDYEARKISRACYEWTHGEPVVVRIYDYLPDMLPLVTPHDELGEAVIEIQWWAGFIVAQLSTSHKLRCSSTLRDRR